MPRFLTTYCVAAVALLLACRPSGADTAVDPLFASDTTLDVEIEAPLDMLAEERPDDEEFPGKFRYTAEDGTLVEFDMVVRTRGRVRRNKRTCAFPPLRLNFRKSQLDGTLFDKQDKLKLVTHCRNRAWKYEQAVVAEYLAYRILNLLTDRSLHARLLRVNYVFSDEDREFSTVAMLIEHSDRLEKRLDGKVSKTERARIEDIEPADLNLTSVFQYLIGNTDFSPVATAPDEDCCHNQILLERESGLSYTVPYDFDQSGLVDAPYAAPNPRFRLESVRDRMYRGRCSNNAYLDDTLQLFRDRRAEIEELIRAQPELMNRTSRRMLKFIDEFYVIIDDPDLLWENITSRCL